MTEWMYGVSGHPQIIVDGDRFLDRRGINTIGWVNGSGVFTLTGQHAGWFENGVLSDVRNQCAGFTLDAIGAIPSRPDLAGTLALPELGKCPKHPDFGATPTQPERGDFSKIPLEYIFDDAQPLAPTVHSGFNYRS